MPAQELSHVIVGVHMFELKAQFNVGGQRPPVLPLNREGVEIVTTSGQSQLMQVV